MLKISQITLALLTTCWFATGYAASKVDIPKTGGSYGTNPAQAADLYHPPTGILMKGLVIWVHGGSWTSGDKSDGIDKLIAPLLANGVAVLSMNYRLRDEGAFPNSVEDVQTVLSAVDNGGCATCTGSVTWQSAQNYAKYGLMVSGFSAGGYLAVMGGMRHLGLNPNSALKCIGNVVGPVDLRAYPETTDKQKYAVTVLSGGNLSESRLNSMSPVAYMMSGAWNATAPKVKWYLRFNIRDKLTQFERTSQFIDALKSTGARGSLETVNESGMGHGISPATAQKFIINPIAECLVGKSLDTAQ